MAKLPGGETTGYRDEGIETIKHIHIRYTFASPSPENRKDENRKMWKSKDVKIVAAEILLINSVLVRIKFFSQSVDIVEDASIVGCMKLRTC